MTIVFQQKHGAYWNFSEFSRYVSEPFWEPQKLRWLHHASTRFELSLTTWRRCLISCSRIYRITFSTFVQACAAIRHCYIVTSMVRFFLPTSDWCWWRCHADVISQSNLRRRLSPAASTVCLHLTSAKRRRRWCHADVICPTIYAFPNLKY